MRKRFILILQDSRKEQNDAFKAYLRKEGFGWWHWLPETWLLVDGVGQLTAGPLRDKAKEHYPGEHLLVIELKGSDDSWAGLGPNTEQRNMFKWIKDTWKQKEPSPGSTGNE